MESVVRGHSLVENHSQKERKSANLHYILSTIIYSAQPLVYLCAAGDLQDPYRVRSSASRPKNSETCSSGPKHALHPLFMSRDGHLEDVNKNTNPCCIHAYCCLTKRAF